MLNAFRHQRESHIYNNATRAELLEVLNAFRHQRESHTAILDQLDDGT